MKLFKTILTGSAFFIFNSAAHADYGVCQYGSETLSSISCYGTASLNGTTVTGQSFTAGPFTAQNATLNSVDVRGIAKLYSSSVSGGVTILGPLYATDSKFSGSLYVASNKVDFEGVTLNNSLHIKSTTESPTLTISKGSKLQSVTFEGEAGVVVVEDNSSVGDIINGHK